MSAAMPGQAERDHAEFIRWFTPLDSPDPFYGPDMAEAFAAGMRAARALAAEEPNAAPGDVVHLSPRDATYVTPCCGQTPFELARADRMTNDPSLVTCGRPEPKAAPELELGSCPFQGHHGEHLRLNTHGHWLCAITLTNMLVAADVIADPAPDVTKLRAELDEEQGYRSELTNDILLNAPESFDGDEAADVIAVRYVRHLEAEIAEHAEPQPAPELAAATDLELAGIIAQRNQFRMALERIAGYAAGTATKQMIGTAARRALEGK